MREVEKKGLACFAKATQQVSQGKANAAKPHRHIHTYTHNTLSFSPTHSHIHAQHALSLCFFLVNGG